MKFYAIEERLRDAIAACRTPVRVEVAFDFTGTGDFVAVPEGDIIELTVTSLRETSGGTIAWGTVILDNETRSYCPRSFDGYNGTMQGDGQGNLRAGRAVRISYATGHDIPFVKRFVLYVDENGFQQTETGPKKRVCRVGLVDLAARLKETDREKDWTNPEVIVHSAICDKEFPDVSIVHRIAARAGLDVTDIDCSTITEYLPYVRLTRSVWEELSDLATVYGAHLETACEKPLVFVKSDDGIQYDFDATNVTHVRMHDLRSRYRNTLRLRWTRYREFADVELWRYADPPVIYTNALEPTFPFVTGGEKRSIEKSGYEARYTLETPEGRRLSVVYAERVDGKETFEANLVTDGPALRLDAYDVTTYRDRAGICLGADADTVLRSATIRGDAIAGEASFSYYIDDPDEVRANGTVAMNISTPYLSETPRDEIPFYIRYAADLLARLKRARKGFFLKTNRGVFHARVGAPVRVNLPDGAISGRAEIVRMDLRYKTGEAFVASFFLEEE